MQLCMHVCVNLIFLHKYILFKITLILSQSIYDTYCQNITLYCLLSFNISSSPTQTCGIFYYLQLLSKLNILKINIRRKEGTKEKGKFSNNFSRD